MSEGERPDQELEADIGPGAQVELDGGSVPAPPEQPEDEEQAQHHREEDPLGVVDPAEVGEELRQHLRRSLGLGPGGPRAAGLLEEAGQPRQEEEAAGGHRGDDPEPGRALLPRRPPPGHHEDEPGGPEEVEGPVVGQEEGAGDEGHGDQATPRRLLQGPLHDEPADEDQEHDQGVHAGFGAVPAGEGQGPEHEEGEPAQGGAARPTTDEPGHGQGGDGEEAGKRTDLDVAGAEELGPDVEEDVVERGVPVVTEGFADVAQGQRGDVDAERFVQPQGRRGEESGHRTDHGHDEGQGDQPCRRRGGGRGTVGAAASLARAGPFLYGHGPGLYRRRPVHRGRSGRPARPRHEPEPGTR